MTKEICGEKHIEHLTLRDSGRFTLKLLWVILMVELLPLTILKSLKENVIESKLSVTLRLISVTGHKKRTMILTGGVVVMDHPLGVQDQNMITPQAQLMEHLPSLRRHPSYQSREERVRKLS
ncbi:uncharacterized protein LOC144434699 [Glandiceps talaboti]